jgi:trans-aconitate 2-methyltransferase
MSTHEWDAEAYQRLSEPQFAWGLRVLDRLPLEGDEAVMDAGCGSGRLTAVLAARLPRGRVLAVDRSSNMVEEARRRLAPLGDRIAFACADLAAFVAEPPVDVVFSTATFHWIHDHDRLFASLHACLRPGGRLVAQCGGEGNLARFLAHAGSVAGGDTFARFFEAFEPTWNFQNPAATAERLRRAGFVDVACTLEDAPTPFADEATFRAFLRTVVLRAHLDALPDEETRDRFLDAVIRKVEAAGPLALDYVRLNLTARRAG